MIAAEIDAGANAYGTLRRFERAGKLLRLCVRDAIAAEEFPGTRDRPEPIFHLRDDEAAELFIGELLDPEHGDGDERFSGRRVRWCNLGHDREIVDGTGAITVEDKHRLRDGRFFRRIIKAGHAARGGLCFADEMSGGGALHRDDNGAGAELFAAGKGEFVFMETVYMDIQTNGISGKFCSELRGNRADATGRDGSVSF